MRRSMVYINERTLTLPEEIGALNFGSEFAKFIAHNLESIVGEASNW